MKEIATKEKTSIVISRWGGLVYFGLLALLLGIAIKRQFAPIELTARNQIVIMLILGANLIALFMWANKTLV